jgi:hypothetical protein
MVLGNGEFGRNVSMADFEEGVVNREHKKTTFGKLNNFYFSFELWDCD